MIRYGVWVLVLAGLLGYVIGCAGNTPDVSEATSGMETRVYEVFGMD